MPRQRGINSLRFNQDHGLFSSSMESGARIYNVEPLAEKANYDVRLLGSIAICEMVFRTNIIGLVAGGNRMKYADNDLLVFDTTKKKVILQLSYKSSITAVRMKRDKIAVSLCNNVYVHSFPGIQLLVSLDIRDNTRGLLEMTSFSRGGDREILVFPGCKRGALGIMDITNNDSAQSSTPASIECHNSDLSCITLNQEGTKVATASVRGTIIRVWDTIKKQKIIELRRGCDAARIYSLAFNSTSDYLCCSSDKGTVHVFAINDSKLNRLMIFGSFLGKFGIPLKSFANFQLPPECPCVCGFGSNDSIVAIAMDGTFHKYTFSLEGKCARVGYDVFVDIVGENIFF